MMNNIMNQVQSQEENAEVMERVSKVYKAVLKHTMNRKMKAELIRKHIIFKHKPNPSNCNHILMCWVDFI